MGGLVGATRRVAPTCCAERVHGPGTGGRHGEGDAHTVPGYARFAGYSGCRLDYGWVGDADEGECARQRAAFVLRLIWSRGGSCLWLRSLSA